MAFMERVDRHRARSPLLSRLYLSLLGRRAQSLKEEIRKGMGENGVISSLRLPVS